MGWGNPTPLADIKRAAHAAKLIEAERDAALARVAELEAENQQLRYACSWADLSDERVANIADCERSGRFEDLWHIVESERDAARAELAALRDQVGRLVAYYRDHTKSLDDVTREMDVLAAAPYVPTEPCRCAEKRGLSGCVCVPCGCGPAAEQPESRTWSSDANTNFITNRSPEQIVAWINSNGGEARYEPARYGMPSDPVEFPPTPARIVITGPNGPVIAKPGDTVTMGEDSFWYFDGEATYNVHEFTVSAPGGSS